MKTTCLGTFVTKRQYEILKITLDFHGPAWFIPHSSALKLIYRNFALCVLADIAGEPTKPEWQDYPGIEEGVRGMRFIERVVESSSSDKKWLEF